MDWLERVEAWKARGLSSRAAHGLANRGVSTSEEILSLVGPPPCTVTAWAATMPNVGKVSVQEIVALVAPHEIELSLDTERARDEAEYERLRIKLGKP